MLNKERDINFEILISLSLGLCEYNPRFVNGTEETYTWKFSDKNIEALILKSIVWP